MYNSDYNRIPEDREPIETEQFHVYEAEPPKQKKRKGAARFVALGLCCALIGGLAGGGGVLAYNHFAGGSTTIYQGSAPSVAVNLAQVDGHTVLTPEEIYAANLGAVVGVNGSVTTNVFGYTVKNAVSGSGFVISSNATTSYILTNYHVINDVSDITVFFADGTSYDATLVGGEQENDIAVLRVEQGNLQTVTLGDSDALNVGEEVYAIGNPLGELTFSLTGGYVSALDRNVTMSDGRRMNYIQTDTAINSGNSGGPLFDQYGQVVGIVSAKLSNNGDSTEASVEGVGFAIPIDNVWNMITDIMEYGYVTGKPYMGIINTSVSGEAQRYGTPAGAYVLGVVEDSCAAKAGLQEGDIITKLDDTDITSSDDLQNALADYRAGDTATLTVSRSGQVQTLTITFDERTDERVAASQELHDQLEEEQNQQYSNQQQYGNGGGIFWPFGW